MAARGRPRPAITWWLGGRQIGRQLTDSNFKIRGLGAESELFVRPLAERYYAGYSCRATNAHGEHNVTLHLRTATVPGPVRQVQPFLYQLSNSILNSRARNEISQSSKFYNDS